MKILQLTNYPTARPQHGGQLRAWHIANELRKAGHLVRSVAVYVKDHYVPDTQDDIAFDAESPFWDDNLHFLLDYMSGIFAAEDKNAQIALEGIVADYQPDVIFCEHPWLMAAARKVAASRPGIKLVYSSHNVESRLKAGILKKARLAHHEAERLASEIETIECDAVACADLVIACTAADAEYYRTHAPDREVVVAGNGVEPFSCKPDRIEAWRRFIGAPFPVFVSSAHIPNASGFWDMMAPGLTFLRPDERVLIVGGVSDLIMQMKGFDEYRMLNRDRMEIMGRMEKNELQAVVSAAHVVLLPIVEGEGSNLKTAEALESGCSIVGTSKAFRGFEKALALPHVHIADDPILFRQKVRELLDAPRYVRGTPEEIRSQFYWERLLGGAMSRIEVLTAA